MGGPIDEDPPVLQESYPKDQTLNTKPEEITLTFDEYIKLENPTKGIIITPRLNKDEIVFLATKNKVIITLNQELEENTTYVFDFQKSIVDISEENPAENLKLVFSTGSSIDSIALSGHVNFFFPDARIDYKNVLVGIYPVDDTTDVFTAQPYYLSQVDTLGNFKITNVKNGSYRAYAWQDDNGSLKAEFKSENYDFLLDTIELNNPIENVQFNLSKADLTPLRLLRSAPFGRNYDLILNKNTLESQIDHEEIGKEYFYKNSDKRIRIYPKSSKADSIPFRLNLQDSVGFSVDTLVWAKFPESDRKPEKLTVSANSGKSFYQQLEMELSFNKPILDIITDSLYIQYDTASYIPLTSENFYFKDSSSRDLLQIRVGIPDSIAKEIFTLKAADSTFLDIEGLFNEDILNANYKKLKSEALADEISGTISGASPPFIVQLIDSKNTISEEIFIENSQIFSFQLIEPGNYKIRVIEDLNGNKQWDPSNFVQKRNAERVFYFKNQETKDEIVVRAGWSLGDQNIQATRPSGIQKE